MFDFLHVFPEHVRILKQKNFLTYDAYRLRQLCPLSITCHFTINTSIDLVKQVLFDLYRALS